MRFSMTEMTPTNHLEVAVCNYLNLNAPRLVAEHQPVWQAMLDGKAEIRVSVYLREGAVRIEALNKEEPRRCYELWREDVAPFRSNSGFGEPDTALFQ
jgi:hypothetical protein